MLVNRNDKNVRKQHLNFSKIEMEYDTTIPHLGVHPEKSLIQKDACTSRFITALFTIAKAWKQPVSINRRMDEADMVHTYSGILLSCKTEGQNAFCSNMEGARDHHTE